METIFLARLVETINEHRTWIRAELSEELVPYFIPHAGNEKVIYGRSMKLESYRCMDGYSKGHKWTIHEYVLDKSVRKLRAFDIQFAFNFARRRLSLEQIEQLIEESTLRLVHLHLDPYSF